MTKNGKTNLLHFITRTGKYVFPVDDKNITSFIHGYELGTKHKCDFTQLLKQLLTDKYKFEQSNDSWWGQISRFAKRKSQSWVATFKIIALEVVADELHGGLDKTMIKILKTRIISLMERINDCGEIWVNDHWIEEWLSLCSTKNTWGRQLWTNKEWTTIKSITKQIQAYKVFAEKDKHIPTQKLLKLKKQFDGALQ